MLQKFYERLYDIYIYTINKMVELPDTLEKSVMFAKVLTSFGKFCEKHNIKMPEFPYDEIRSSSYILPSEPKIMKVDSKLAEDAAIHLQDVLNNGGGISREEAETLLNWSVQKTRAELAKSSRVGIMKDNLGGVCGEAQALSLIPFISIGANVTINNTGSFIQDDFNYHAFGTVTFPIDENGVVNMKRFLIDVSYRQFFPTFMCNEGEFYTSVEKLKGKVGPDAGYYVVRYPGGKEMAMELLRNGFIELKPGVLKAYAVGFCGAQLNINTINDWDSILAMDEQVFYQDLEKQRELDYVQSDLMEYLELTGFPRAGVTR